MQWRKFLFTAALVRGAIDGSGGCGRLPAGLKAASSGARAYTDYRKLLEDKSLDVVVATPDEEYRIIDAPCFMRRRS